MLIQTTVLFKVCFIFIIAGLFLDILAFATVNWLVDGDDERWTSGLWQVCVVEARINTTGYTTCSSAHDYAYLLTHTAANSTSKIRLQTMSI